MADWGKFVDHSGRVTSKLGVAVEPGTIKARHVPIPKQAYMNYATHLLNLLTTPRGIRIIGLPSLFMDRPDEYLQWWRMSTAFKPWYRQKLDAETEDETAILQPLRDLARSIGADGLHINGMAPQMRTGVHQDQGAQADDWVRNASKGIIGKTTGFRTRLLLKSSGKFYVQAGSAGCRHEPDSAYAIACAPDCLLGVLCTYRFCGPDSDVCHWGQAGDDDFTINLILDSSTAASGSVVSDGRWQWARMHSLVHKGRATCVDGRIARLLALPCFLFEMIVCEVFRGALGVFAESVSQWHDVPAVASDQWADMEHIRQASKSRGHLHGRPGKHPVDCQCGGCAKHPANCPCKSCAKHPANCPCKKCAKHPANCPCKNCAKHEHEEYEFDPSVGGVARPLCMQLYGHGVYDGSSCILIDFDLTRPELRKVRLDCGHEMWVNRHELLDHMGDAARILESPSAGRMLAGIKQTRVVHKKGDKK